MRLDLRPVALLVFLAGAAGAGIVAADFFGAADDLLDGALLAAAGHARLFEFAALLALEAFFEIVDRGCNLPRRTSVAALRAAVFQRGRRRPRDSRRDAGATSLRWPLEDLHQVEILNG